MNLRGSITRLSLALLTHSLSAAEPNAPNYSADELTARLRAARQDGNASIRLRMHIADKADRVLQIQIKSRATRGGAELVYQVLFPKERKGEAVLLRRAGGRISGTLYTPPDDVRTLTSAQLDEPLFGSALSYEDVIDDFFAWDHQTIVGNETVDRVNCVILESKPGKSQRSSYSGTRTWVDPRRLVPLRIEKYSASDPSRIVRRIDTTRVVSDDRGRAIPASLSVRGPGGLVTEIDGARITHGMIFSDSEFTPSGLKDLSIPRGAPAASE